MGLVVGNIVYLLLQSAQTAAIVRETLPLCAEQPIRGIMNFTFYYLAMHRLQAAIMLYAVHKRIYRRRRPHHNGKERNTGGEPSEKQGPNDGVAPSATN